MWSKLYGACKQLSSLAHSLKMAGNKGVNDQPGCWEGGPGANYIE